MKKKPGSQVKKIGIIGLGKMGQALALGLRQDAASGVSLQATCRSAANAAKLAGDLGIPVHLDSKNWRAKVTSFSSVSNRFRPKR